MIISRVARIKFNYEEITFRSNLVIFVRTVYANNVFVCK